MGTPPSFRVLGGGVVVVGCVCVDVCDGGC